MIATSSRHLLYLNRQVNIWGTAAIWNQVAANERGVPERTPLRTEVEFEDTVRCLIGHQPTRELGSTDTGNFTVAITDHGLQVSLDLIDTPAGCDVLRHLHFSDGLPTLTSFNGWSVGGRFLLTDGRVTYLRVREISLVCAPAWDSTLNIKFPCNR